MGPILVCFLNVMIVPNKKMYFPYFINSKTLVFFVHFNISMVSVLMMEDILQIVIVWTVVITFLKFVETSFLGFYDKIKKVMMKIYSMRVNVKEENSWDNNGVLFLRTCVTPSSMSQRGLVWKVIDIKEAQSKCDLEEQSLNAK